MKPVSRPIALLKRRDIDSCTLRAEAAISQWQQDWLSAAFLTSVCGEADGVSPAKAAGLESGNEVWHAYRQEQGGVIWCHWQDEFEKRLERELFGLDESVRTMDRHRESGLAKSVVSKAVSDLVASLLTGLAGSAVPEFDSAAGPDAWLFNRLSGTAWLRLMAGDAALSIFIPAEIFNRDDSITQQTASPKASPLTPLPTAVADIGVRIVAGLGEVDMSIGNFASLALGDVINLMIPIDQPLTVYSENHSPVGAAHLGQQDGHRALEMFRLPQK